MYTDASLAIGDIAQATLYSLDCDDDDSVMDSENYTCSEAYDF
jgi:hypothetical protein